ncbi:MAG TPA: lipocalin-like domain-containing protein [Thermomicrobiales bacterium]|nr:lipocalin-like domain-containing protein [Thermomicrobiales bacterium]
MDALLGTWRLVSVEFIGDDGEMTYPFGPDATGLLMYSADGHMSAVLMQQGRGSFDGMAVRRHLSDVSDAAVRAAYEGYVSYCGTWTVDEGHGTVTHHVTESLNPAEVGRDNVRAYTLDGNRMRLEPVGGPVRAVITWERAERFR